MRKRETETESERESNRFDFKIIPKQINNKQKQKKILPKKYMVTNSILVINHIDYKVECINIRSACLYTYECCLQYILLYKTLKISL